MFLNRVTSLEFFEGFTGTALNSQLFPSNVADTNRSAWQQLHVVLLKYTLNHIQLGGEA